MRIFERKMIFWLVLMGTKKGQQQKKKKKQKQKQH
jgi:hypothetical protein